MSDEFILSCDSDKFEFKLPAGITKWDAGYWLKVFDNNGDSILEKWVWSNQVTECTDFKSKRQMSRNLETKIGEYLEIWFSDFLEPEGCSALVEATLLEPDSALELFDDYAIVWIDDPEAHYHYTQQTWSL